MATIKDVARRAKVSVGTVSNVIGGLAPVRPQLRERVEHAIQELDYHPDHIARSLKTRETKMLGMVIPDITNPFFPLIVRGAEDAALAHGYLLVTFNTDDRVEREEQVLAMLRRRRMDGILLVVAPGVGKAAHIEGVLSAGIPIVCLDRAPQRLSVDAVTVDNVRGAEMCVRHLIQLGHRRIGTITGPLELGNARERLRGYENALRENVLPLETELIRVGDFRSESGYRLGKELCLTADRPTAIFVSNGMMALGLLKALKELGLECPDDIAVAAFDRVPGEEAFHPGITAVVQPCYDIGNKGAELLIQRIAGQLPAKARHIRLQTELITKESTIGWPRRNSASRV